MTTLTTPITKEIKYNHGEYDMYLNGEYIGSEASYHSAEVELDRLAFEQLDRAGIEPEMMQSATALDGGSSQDEIAAEYAVALEPVLVAAWEGDVCLGCGQEACTCGHNITLPDPAECPDVRAPQPCEDLLFVTLADVHQRLIAERMTRAADTSDPFDASRTVRHFRRRLGTNCERSSTAAADETEPDDIISPGGRRIDTLICYPKGDDPCAELRAAVADLLGLIDRELPQFADTVIVQAARAALTG